MVARVPGLLGQRLRQDSFRGSNGGPRSSRDGTQPRTFEVPAIAPDKTQRMLSGVSGRPVRDLARPLLLEFGLVAPAGAGVEWAALRLAGSRARVDPCADAALLEGEVLLVEDARPTGEDAGVADARLSEARALLRGEREFRDALAAAQELYARPLQKLQCLTPPQHHALFGGLAALAAPARALVTRLAEVVDAWEPGCPDPDLEWLFPEELWEGFDAFLENYGAARRLLRQKSAADDELLELCRIRRGAALDTPQSLLELPVQRLAQYEQFFAALQDSRHSDDAPAPDPSPDDSGRHVRSRAKQALRRGQVASDLERIQDLFPHDDLRLHDREALTMKMKGLIRKRSTTAARLHRALSAKALRPSPDDGGGGGGGGGGGSPGALAASAASPPGSRPQRTFLLEAPVRFTTGVQSQDRHLFLFSDLLLVAKPRSGGHFKLKEQVRASEMWMARSGLEEVSEAALPGDTAFVLGWPTGNVVASFATQAARDLWWGKLSEVVAAERAKEPAATNIQVLYYDLATNIEYVKTLSVGPEESARACVALALQALELRGLRPDDFQLWAKTARDEAPYPLVGHERPFAIKLSCLRDALARDALAADEGFDLEHCSSPRGPLFAHCQFILRSKRKASDTSAGLDGKKSGGIGKKSRKSPMRIRQVFRRSQSKDNVDGSVPGNPASSPPSPGALFGVPLSRLMVGDTPPRPVMAMLQQVAEQGPHTQGIFRRSANARLVRELRDRLDAGGDNATRALEGVPVLVTAALLKDFLRSLPDPLLCARLYPLWMEALDCPDEQERLARVKSVLDQLPRAHLVLLQLFMCVLHLVARRSQQNLMSAGNLGVCVGPSLLRPLPSAAPASPLSPAQSRAVPALVELLVARCELLLGPHVPHLLGHDAADGPANVASAGNGAANGAAPPDQARGDSGAEESDSLHSSGLRRDDSSIDSLERELLEPGHLPPPRKDKMSLSRDSGLTMSDSQLYTPDEEESSSSSSAGSGRGLYPPPQAPQQVSSTGNVTSQQQAYEPLHSHTKVTPSYSVPNTTNGLPVSNGPREYVRVYGGWEERVADCCREDSVYARPSRLLQQSQPSQHQQNQHQPLNPNFQREHWFRQRSHLKRMSSGGSGGKLGGGGGSSGVGSGQSGIGSSAGSSSGSASSGVGGLHSYHAALRRSASEESLLSDADALLKRPALHRKGRAPPPPPPPPAVLPNHGEPRVYPVTPLLRSKSAHHLPDAHATLGASPSEKRRPSAGSGTGAEATSSLSGPQPLRACPAPLDDWARSRSTPHIGGGGGDEVDRSYDSSTLSDDDSTPHVSRSNSRGKDCAAANSAWESAYGAAPAELLVRAAPVSIREEPPAEPLPAPPLPPKRPNTDVRLRHLPPVHVDNPRPLSCYADEAWEEGGKHPPERRSRLRYRDGNRASQRSKSLPPPPGSENGASEMDSGQMQPLPERSLSPGLKGELSWSVRHLRSLFSGGQQPPPYRPPPSVIPSHRAPITSFHLGSRSPSERYVVSQQRLVLELGPAARRLRMDSTDEEESYV